MSLLSRCRLSGFPVESAILFGPGLSAIILQFNWLDIKDINKISIIIKSDKYLINHASKLQTQRPTIEILIE